MGLIERTLARFGYVKAEKKRIPTWAEATAELARWTLPNYELYRNQCKAYAQSLWVYFCVTRIAERAALVPYHVYEIDPATEEEVEVQEHPLELLLASPNEGMSGFELMEYTFGSLELTGNAYWYLTLDQRGIPVEIWPLRPDRVEVVPSKTEWVKGYIYHVDGHRIPLEKQEVVHFKRWHPLEDYVGLSPIQAAALAIEGDLNAQRWNARFFHENAIPSGVIAIKEHISDADYDAIVKQWEGKYKGVEGAHKVAFIRGSDVSVETLSIPHRDMEFLEYRKFTQREIFNIYGIPMGKWIENATEANAKVAERTFINDTLWPKLVRVGWKISSEVLSRWGENLRGRFEDIRITDRELQLRELEIVAKGAMDPTLGLPVPLMTVDEMRARYFDLPPMSEVQGKALLEASRRMDTALRQELRRWKDVAVRLFKEGRDPTGREFRSEIIPDWLKAAIKAQLAEAKTLEEVKQAFQPPFGPGRGTREDPAKAKKQAWERRIIAGLLEIWQKHADLVLEWLKRQREVKKRIKAVGDDMAEAEELWEGMSRDYVQLLLPAFEEVMAEAAQDALDALPWAISIDMDLVNAQAAEWARIYTYDLISGINKTTQARLQQAINNWIEAGEDFPSLVQRVQDIFNNPVRAEMIAATEVTRVYAEANTRAWKATGVVKEREWQTAADERVCPICGPLQGKRAKLGKPFPGGIMNPPAHPRCRCWVVPVVE